MALSYIQCVVMLPLLIIYIDMHRVGQLLMGFKEVAFPPS